MYYPNAFNPDVLLDSDVYKTFQFLSDSQFKLEKFSSEKIDQKKQDLSTRLEAEKKAACKALYNRDLTTLDNLQTQVKTTAAVLSQIITALTKPDEQSGLSFIQALWTAEQLAKRFKSAYLLQVKSIAAGGATITTSNIFGSKLSFSGGVVISYMLFDNSGVLVNAGTIPAYGGNRHLQDMK